MNAQTLIDCHAHVFDPARFAYAEDTAYRPAGSEIGTAAQFRQVMDAHGVRHALLVGPNSGYGYDNRCLLDAIAHGGGRFKGIAVVPNDTGAARLAELKAAGIVGVAFNVALLGAAHYADAGPLLARLAALDLFAQVQVEGEQLPALLPLLLDSGARPLIDHCGRPALANGLASPGFRALLELGRQGRAVIKLSGQAKFSRQPFPHDDTLPFVHALIDAFGLDACVWASDWPFLRAPQRLDYGPMLAQVERLLPDAAERRRLLWDTPRRLFGFE